METLGRVERAGSKTAEDVNEIQQHQAEQRCVAAMYFLLIVCNSKMCFYGIFLLYIKETLHIFVLNMSEAIEEMSLVVPFQNTRFVLQHTLIIIIIIMKRIAALCSRAAVPPAG